HVASVVDRLQRHRYLGPRVAGRTRAARRGASLRAAAEQAFEKIAEAATRRAIAAEHFLEIEALAAARAAAPEIRRWTELLAGPIALRTQLVVGLALLRIAQRFIG